MCRALDDLREEIAEGRENSILDDIRSKLAAAREVLEEDGPMTNPRILRARDKLADARKISSKLKDPEAVQVRECVCVCFHTCVNMRGHAVLCASRLHGMMRALHAFLLFS